MKELQMLITENDLLFRIIASILLVLFGILVHYFSKKSITRFLEKRTSFINSKKVVTLTTFLFSMTKYIAYFFIGYLFCKVIKVPIDSVFIAIAGAGSVAFGLGAQTLVKNIINGFFILIEDVYSVGDIVSISGFTGSVEEIGMRTTKLRTIDGNIHIIPNGEITIATNMTKKVAIANVSISVPYDISGEKFIENLRKSLESSTIDGILSPPNVIGITELGKYTYTVKVLADSEFDKYLNVERNIRLVAKGILEQMNAIFHDHLTEEI